MRISVVIPAYNEEKYIQACLESLMKQTKKPFEIIVVNNNSTDNTAKIARSFDGVDVINAKVQGITPTRNAGFNAAKGDIIARTDADTLVPEDWIEHIERLFTKNVVDAVSGPAIYYDSPIQSDAFIKFFFWMSKVLFGHPILFGPNTAITSDTWHTVKKITCPDDSKVHEDLDLSIHIARLGKKILYDSSLIVKCSARRIIRRPQSFFIEYSFRYFRMILYHVFNHE